MPWPLRCSGSPAANRFAPLLGGYSPPRTPSLRSPLRRFARRPPAAASAAPLLPPRQPSCASLAAAAGAGAVGPPAEPEGSGPGPGGFGCAVSPHPGRRSGRRLPTHKRYAALLRGRSSVAAAPVGPPPALFGHSGGFLRRFAFARCAAACGPGRPPPLRGAGPAHSALPPLRSGPRPRPRGFPPGFSARVPAPSLRCGLPVPLAPAAAPAFPSLCCGRPSLCSGWPCSARGRLWASQRPPGPPSPGPSGFGAAGSRPGGCRASPGFGWLRPRGFCSGCRRCCSQACACCAGGHARRRSGSRQALPCALPAPAAPAGGSGRAPGRFCRARCAAFHGSDFDSLPPVARSLCGFRGSSLSLKMLTRYPKNSGHRFARCPLLPYLVNRELTSRQQLPTFVTAATQQNLCHFVAFDFCKRMQNLFPSCASHE